MADGFNVRIDGELAERLKAVAAENQMAVVDYVQSFLGGVFDESWEEDERRFAEYERTGESVSLDEWMEGLRTAIEEKRRRLVDG